jgi:hypothetical protein
MSFSVGLAIQSNSVQNIQTPRRSKLVVLSGGEHVEKEETPLGRII